MEDRKYRLAKLLLEKSYIEGDVTLTSGRKSDYYFDCKQTALHPEGAYLIGKLFLDLLPLEVKAVGGMTLGADPLVTSVSLLSYIENRSIPAFILRKKPKGHGTNQYLEGTANLKSGQKVALVEDVVTSGGTLLKSCELVQEAGLKISHVLCVLDREEGGAPKLAEKGFVLNSLFTRKELLNAR